MRFEIQIIIDQLEEVFTGSPWHGASIISQITDIDESIVYVRACEQHSIIEIVYHMINWRLFAISRLEKNVPSLKFFEENDWIIIKKKDNHSWNDAIQTLYSTQEKLIQLLKAINEELLDKIVTERNYTYKHLFTGIIHHDIYHSGQIAYINKLFKRESK